LASFTGGSGDDVFTAGVTAANNHFSIGDAIDGGLGNDTLNIFTVGAATVPAGVSVSGIETINVVSATDANVFSTATGFTGLTALNVTGIENQTVTAAATTAITVTETGLATVDIVTVNGGSSVTVNSTGAGDTVDTATGGTITVGATTAPTGTVTITATDTSALVAAGDVSQAGAILVTGGSTVNVTSTIAATAAASATVLAGSVAVTHTGSDITVTGTSATTAVTATQAATVAAVNSGTIGRVGIAGGDVIVNDANRASLTDAGTIATVSITNAGVVTVNSGALTTLNLGGTLTTVNAGTSGALTTAANTTLAINLTGAVSTGALTVDTDYTTLNISGNTTASTIADLIATTATNLNVTGDAKVTLTDFDPATLTDVVVTNTAGLVLGTSTLAVGTNYTGGAGADSVILGAVTTAVTMGAGDDTVTSAGLVGTGGSVDAGAGTGDKIIMTSTQAATADGSAVFNSKFTNFEVLEISGAFGTADVIDLDAINNVGKVIVKSGTGHASNAALSNLDSGGTVEFQADIDGLTINVDGAVAGTADVLNVNLAKTTALTHTILTTSNVETLNIDVSDNVAAGSDSVTHIISTLAAAGTTAITVSGNNGLTITAATGSTSVTSFDASGVVANSTAATTFVAATTDSAATLAVTYISVNATANAAVTITGGDGNDTLTGSAAALNVDTISGGAGADLITGGTGNDILTGGAGADDFIFVASNGIDTITDFVSGTDDLDVTTWLIGAVVANTVVTAARAQDTMVNGDIFFITTDGTAASVTSNGTAALTVADLTASTLTNLATFLAEAYASSGTATDDALFVINFDGTNTSYVYDFTESDTTTAMVSSELTLVAIVSNGGTDLTSGDVI
jgi:S-layer protein